MKVPPFLPAANVLSRQGTDALTQLQSGNIQVNPASQSLSPAKGVTTEGVRVQLGQPSAVSSPAIFNQPVAVRTSTISNTEQQTRTSAGFQQQLDGFSFGIKENNRFYGVNPRILVDR